MNKKIWLILLSLIMPGLVITWLGCSSSHVERKVAEETQATGAAEAMPASPTAEPAKAGYMEKREVSDSVTSSTVPPPPAQMEVPPPETVNAELAKPPKSIQPKIIYRGNVKVKVSNLDESIRKLREMTTQYGGNIMDVHSTYREEENYGEAYITVKVPFSKVQDFVTELGTLGKVEDSQMTSEDVTLQWYDIQKDVEKRKIELEAKYLEFQKDPKNYAKKQEYLELYNIYIDQSKRAAQLAYDAENSTVVITLISHPDLWLSALNIGVKILYYVLIVVLVLLPCAGLTLLIIWFIRLLLRLRKPKVK